MQKKHKKRQKMQKFKKRKKMQKKTFLLVSLSSSSSTSSTSSSSSRSSSMQNLEAVASKLTELWPIWFRSKKGRHGQISPLYSSEINKNPKTVTGGPFYDRLSDRNMLYTSGNLTKNYLSWYILAPIGAIKIISCQPC